VSASSRASLLAVATMFGAAALWGGTGGVVAGLQVGGAAAACVVELTTGVVLLGLALATGERPGAAIVGRRRRIALLGAVEAANVLCYYVALQMAPVGPVMALHLAAPVLLTVVALARGRRSVSIRNVSAILMISAALTLVALSGQEGARHPAVLQGLALSLVSAACLAVFLTLVSSTASGIAPAPAAGFQMLVSGLVLCPALMDLRQHGSSLAPLLAVSVALFAPACWLYWFAMRRLTPILAGTVLLTEPFFGVPAAYLVHGLRPSASHAVAIILILGATYIDMTTGSADNAL